MRTTAAILLLCALALTGCSSGSDKADSSAAAVGAGDDGPDAPGATCDGYSAGQDGVVRTFCDGSGTVSWKAGGTSYSVPEVSCVTGGGQLSVNGGVVVDGTFTGTKPDYAGIVIPAKGGDFTNATITLTADGTSFSLTENSGTGDAKSGTFTGKAYGSDTEVTGSYTC